MIRDAIARNEDFAARPFFIETAEIIGYSEQDNGILIFRVSYKDIQDYDMECANIYVDIYAGWVALTWEVLEGLKPKS